MLGFQPLSDLDRHRYRLAWVAPRVDDGVGDGHSVAGIFLDKLHALYCQSRFISYVRERCVGCAIPASEFVAASEVRLNPGDPRDKCGYIDAGTLGASADVTDDALAKLVKDGVFASHTHDGRVLYSLAASPDSVAEYQRKLHAESSQNLLCFKQLVVDDALEERSQELFMLSTTPAERAEREIDDKRLRIETFDKLTTDGEFEVSGVLPVPVSEALEDLMSCGAVTVTYKIRDPRMVNLHRDLAEHRIDFMQFMQSRHNNPGTENPANEPR